MVLEVHGCVWSGFHRDSSSDWSMGTTSQFINMFSCHLNRKIIICFNVQIAPQLFQASTMKCFTIARMKLQVTKHTFPLAIIGIYFHFSEFLLIAITYCTDDEGNWSLMVHGDISIITWYLYWLVICPSIPLRVWAQMISNNLIVVKESMPYTILFINLVTDSTMVYKHSHH